jgi:ribose transport system substrate-binding protein
MRPTARRALAASTALLFAVSLAACAKDDNKSASADDLVTKDLTPGIEAGSGDGLTIGYISYGESLGTVHLSTLSIQKAVEDSGAKFVMCDAELIAEKALECAKNLKIQGVDGVLNFQPDASAAPAVCRELPDVPVIAVSVPQEPCQHARMGVDNRAAGELAGEAAGQYFKENFDCEYDAYVSLEASAAGQNNTDRMGGMRDGFESVCGPIKNLKVQDANEVDTGRSVFADILTSLPDADRILVAGIQDAPLLGAIAAATAAGREEQVFYLGQAADKSAHCEISANPQWLGDTAYFPERYGEFAVPSLIDAIKGKKIEPELLIPIEFVNSDNIGDFYDVEDC